MTGFPGEHPEPPVDLAARSPLIRNLLAGTNLYRIHRSTDGPLFFGRLCRNRFDSPDGSFGVLYVGIDEHCSFIETFGQSTGDSFVTSLALKQRHLSELKVTRTFKLLDLTQSGGLPRIGADARLFSGSHSVSQRWSAALRNHPESPDGLLYPARHDPARAACAVFDCPVTDFVVTTKGSLLEPQNASLLGNILNTYDFAIIDT